MTKYCHTLDVGCKDLLETLEAIRVFPQRYAELSFADPPYNTRYGAGKPNLLYFMFTKQEIGNVSHLVDATVGPGGHGIVFFFTV